jgi:hypothetical protein
MQLLKLCFMCTLSIIFLLIKVCFYVHTKASLPVVKEETNAHVGSIQKDQTPWRQSTRDSFLTSSFALFANVACRLDLKSYHTQHPTSCIFF